jgi:hypothetical protein
MVAVRPASLGLIATSLVLAGACALSDKPTNTLHSAGTYGAGGSSGSATGDTASDSEAMSGGTAGATTNGGAPNDDAGTSANDAAGSAGDAATRPYANVTAVAVTGSDADYTFNVTIESSDVDCSEFADWWEVLTLDGALVYRRILEHSHTDANGTSDPDAPGNTFTRSGGPVPVAATDLVVVRAHMSVGGYNGMVMQGSVANGFSDAPDIGSNFATNVEGDDPQPTGCEF